MTAPIGSTLVHRYYLAPRDLSEGEPHDDLGEAVADALERWAQVPGDFPVFPPVVDEMWVMADPATGTRYHLLHQRTTVAPGLTEGDHARTGADRRAVADRVRASLATVPTTPQAVRS